MTKDDLREVVERLRALESLTQLFNNLWFDKIRGDIKDEKVKAYLMVFEDALPGLDKVIDYVVKNAEHLSEDQTYEVREGFDLLSQALLNRETQMDLMLEDDLDPDIFEEEHLDEEGGGQDDDAMGSGHKTVDQGAIDELFSEGAEEDAQDDAQEIEHFFADDNDVPPEDIGNESEEELADLPLDDGTADSEEEDLEDLLSDEEDDSEEEDLEDLLSDEEDDSEEEDLEDLLSEEEDDSEEDDMDLDDLLGDDDDEGGADISEEEMTALLDDDEDEEDAPPPKKKVAPKAKAKAKKAPPKKEPEEDGDGLSQVSQDEIDALFG